MENEYLKALWILRFQKLKKTEREAARVYQGLYERCLHVFGSEDEVVRLLKQLVREELAHEALAEGLIEVCRDTHPEVNDITRGEDDDENPDEG